MSLAFVIESFKFWRIKNGKTVSILFLTAFAWNFLALLFPLGDTDFSRLLAWIQNFTSNVITQGSALLPDPNAQSILSVGNLVYFGFLYFIAVGNACFALIYASAVNAGFDDYPMNKGVKQFFRSLPSLLILALLMLVPYVLSLFLFGLPILVLGSLLAFAPMFMIDRKAKLSKALDDSVDATRGIRMQMVFAYMFVIFALGIPKDFLTAMVPANLISRGLIASFFSAVQAMTGGRLYALFYLYYSRSYPARRLSGPYHPHDPSAFFTEVDRRIAGEEEDEAKDDDDDSLY